MKTSKVCRKSNFSSNMEQLCKDGIFDIAEETVRQPASLSSSRNLFSKKKG
jgi:hypothetical protein